RAWHSPLPFGVLQRISFFEAPPICRWDYSAYSHFHTFSLHGKGIFLWMLKRKNPKDANDWQSVPIDLQGILLISKPFLNPLRDSGRDFVSIGHTPNYRLLWNRV